MKGLAKMLLNHMRMFVLARPRVRNVTVAVLDRFPGLKLQLMGALSSSVQPYFAGARKKVPADLAHLTPRARQIYADLKINDGRRSEKSG